MSDIIKKFNKKRRKVWIISGILLSSLVTVTTLGIVLTKTSNKNKIKEKLFDLYDKLFIKKIKKSIEIFPEFENGIKAILSELKNYSSSDVLPEYHHTSDMTNVKNGKKEIFQITDHGFKKGKGKFSKWGNKIVFILENGKLIDAHYKGGVNRLIKSLIKTNDALLINKIKNKFKNEKNIYISYGWIDSHVHVFSKSSYTLSKTNFANLEGVVAVIDAGSSGLNNFSESYNENKNNPFKTFYLLNVSPWGIVNYPEVENSEINIKQITKTIEENPEVIGIKMRYSKQAILSGVDYINILKEIHKSKSMVMFHVGNEPPPFDELLKYLKSGDIITHYSHGKNSNVIKNIDKIVDAGVFLDIGMGQASFSSNMFESFLEKNFLPTSISTDMHDNVLINKSARINKIMEYLLSQGLEINEIIEMVTTNPYDNYLNNNYKNYFETRTIFSIEESNDNFFIDSEERKTKVNFKIRVLGVVSEKGEKWY